MFRRKAKAAEQAVAADSDPSDEQPDVSESAEPAGGGDLTEGAPDQPTKPERPRGPWDISEVDPDKPAHTAARLDLGGLRIRPAGGMKVQMQVEQATGKATSVLLVGDAAAVQLMVIAASKSKPLWPQTRRALQSDADRKGGSAAESDGPWGPVLRMAIPATTADGKKGVQPSVVLGIDGPRWMLRATMIGRAATDQAVMNQMMGIVQDTVVVRGDVAMSPGEVIGLTPPPRPESATPIEDDPAAAADGEPDVHAQDEPSAT
jgi:hypothetical protein